MEPMHVLPKGVQIGQSNTQESANSFHIVGIGEEKTQEDAIEAAIMDALDKLAKAKSKSADHIFVLQSNGLSSTPVISGSRWNATYCLLGYCLMKRKT